MNKARGRPSDRVPSLKPLHPMPPNPASKDLMAAPTTPSPGGRVFSSTAQCYEKNEDKDHHNGPAESAPIAKRWEPRRRPTPCPSTPGALVPPASRPRARSPCEGKPICAAQS